MFVGCLVLLKPVRCECRHRVTTVLSARLVDAAIALGIEGLAPSPPQSRHPLKAESSKQAKTQTLSRRVCFAGNKHRGVRRGGGSCFKPWQPFELSIGARQRFAVCFSQSPARIFREASHVLALWGMWS